MQLKKTIKPNLSIFLLIAVCVAVISFSLLSPIQQASADFNDLPSDTIVNFNQLLPNQYINNYSLTSSLVVANIPVDHVFYLRIKSVDNMKWGVGSFVSDSNNNFDLIFTNNYNSNSFAYYKDVNDTIINNALLIDLTLMFGGNEPNLEQCRSIFTSDYYAYNTGTPMPLSSSYLEGYNQGVADTLNSFTYKLNNASVQQSMQAVNMGDYYGEITRYSNYVVINNTTNNYPTGYLPFLGVMPTGAHFKFSARVTHNDGNGTLPVQIGYIINGNMQILTQFIVTGGYANSYSAEFDAPTDLSGLYFILNDNETDSLRLTIYNATIEVLNIDYSKLVESAVQNAISETKLDYMPGGIGYQSIYQDGYNDGLSNGNTVGSAWDFIGGTFSSIGAIFSLEVMPNITLGVFIAVPLLLGLLLFILKITRG